MTTFVEPTGEMPFPDSNGEIVLVRSNSKRAEQTIVAALAAVWGTGSVIYWIARGFSKSLPDFWTGSTITTLAAVGLLANGFLPLSIPLVFFPIQLKITPKGIEYIARSTKRRILWDKIVGIDLVPMPINQFGGVQRVTIIKGEDETIQWDPIFDVSPESLEQLLISYHRKYATNGEDIMRSNDENDYRKDKRFDSISSYKQFREQDKKIYKYAGLIFIPVLVAGLLLIWWAIRIANG